MKIDRSEMVAESQMCKALAGREEVKLGLSMEKSLWATKCRGCWFANGYHCGPLQLTRTAFHKVRKLFGSSSVSQQIFIERSPCTENIACPGIGSVSAKKCL
jgi:hypothetical protein